MPHEESHPTPAEQRSERGNLMAIVFGIMMVLVTLVAALHHQQVIVGRTVTRGAANLEFAQGLRLALAQEAGRSVPGATQPKVTGAVDVVYHGDLTDQMYSQLWTGLPSLAVTPAADKPVGYDEFTVTPRTTDLTLQVFGRRQVRVTGHSSASFAAYAPVGDIELTRLYGWANPTFEDEREPALAYSGVPALVYAGGDVRIGEVVHGSVYSSKQGATIDLGEDSLALAFVGSPPLKPYAQQLLSTLERTRSDLETTVAGANKTSHLRGPRTPAGDVVDLFWGVGSTLNLHLQQALQFPMPGLPSVAGLSDGPALFWFHLPAAARNSGLGATAPVTRAGDDAFQDNDPPGTTGWAWPSPSSELGVNLPWICMSLLEGNFTGTARQLVEEVRLVHFGARRDQDTAQLWSLSDPLRSEAGWTVPRGRTLRIDGDLEIVGDLWIQKGAALSVGGNLTLVSPRAPIDEKPLWPNGRLVLEEGGVLLVNGDFRCEGSPRTGSVLVGSRPGAVRPITSAIFASGQVDLPFGTRSGVNLEELACALEEQKAIGSGLKAALTPLFTSVGPNLAKLSGPFHRREPYLGQFAATYEMTAIGKAGDLPPVDPAPREDRNLLTSIFTVLATVHTSALNFSLGEHLYLEADWWPFRDGEYGVVPVIPKLDPDRTLEAGRADLPAPFEIAFDTLLAEFARKAVSDAATAAVREVIQPLVMEVATAVSPPAATPYTPAVADIVERVNADLAAVTALEAKALGSLRPNLAATAGNWVVRLQRLVQHGADEAALREVAGLLVFADTIRIGHNRAFTTPDVCAGMFVARQGVDINCRYTVGTIVSAGGALKARTLLYSPWFSRASLYRPGYATGDWVAQGLDSLYGDQAASGSGFDIGPGRTTLLTEGWSR